MSALTPSKEFFERIPTTPGVYLMKDRAGRIVYVGKAKNLRTRVRQYFRPGADARFFVAAGLLGRVLADVETVVVDNEKEALLLENHLIKQHQPRFNINLRDDKQYLVLRLDPEADYPRVEVVRNLRDDRARYFGPYHSATSCRETLRILNRHFQLRTCTDHVMKTRTRPCLQYQIKRCPGPCVYPVERETYAEQVEDVMMFLSGKDRELVARLRERMQERAEHEDYEGAARLRDSIAAVDKTLARQNVVQEQFVDQDVFGMWREDDVVEVAVLFVRGGKLVGRRSVRERDQEFPDGQVMAGVVQQHYAGNSYLPDEIVVGVALDDQELIADWLSERRGRKVKILNPQRGTRTRLLSLAEKNAAAQAASRQNRDRDTEATLGKLEQRLGLKRLPRRVECFDIAHLQGVATVASMVVFVDGVPDRALYRRFKVKSVANDDFAAMYEVLSRRFKRAVSEDGRAGDPAWQAPDLLVVDGGKGQLGQALAALKDLGIAITAEKGFDVIGLAKERDDASGSTQPDRVFLRNRKDPIRLRPNTAELYLLSRIRDEAHRFANTFHREQRRRSALRSSLDDIPGIGLKRRKALLRHFGSLKAIKQAGIDELAAVVGMSRPAAEAVRRFFDGDGA
ncbi:excinuclease ABC subunit UvrC [Haliangium sp.]|uniref:excinuclease ABC subunit UvrC n=1 Tax=Haliangium sp. TaxID=2663208 RepID=UPI003D1168F0